MNNLKKIIGIFGILSFVCFTNSFATTGIVNTPAARVREKASTDSEIVTKVYEDEEVEILEEDGDWYKVKANGKTGYVSKSLIKSSESNTKNTNTTANNTNTSTNTATNTTSTNTTKNDNVSNYDTNNNEISNEEKDMINKDTALRLLPNFASNELRILTKDTEVKIEKTINNWTKISLSDNSTGWVLNKNISKAKVATTSEEDSATDNDDKNTVEVENTVNENKTSENTVSENTVSDDNANSSNENTTVTNTTNTTTSTTTSNSKGKVIVETANVREKASKSSEIIERLDEGDEVTIVEEDGEWYKITSTKVSSGYVSKTLIKVISEDVTSRSLSEARENEISDGNSVVEFAKQFLGTNYVLGGKTPESGFDCSGFTRYIFKNFGYSLGSVAADQESVGREVKREELQPGDLILFYNEGKTKIGHTGIYIGNNEFIHAANPERGVVIDNLETMDYYNERFVTARRIVE